MTYGQDWTQSNIVSGEHYVCAANDNGIMYAAKFGDKVYKSTDYGHTWTAVLATLRNYQSIACSSNGQYVYVTVASSSVGYKSSDYGVTWGAAGTVTNTYESIPDGLCCSDSGQYVYARTTNNSVNVSSNYGVSFSLVSIPATSQLYGIACNASGSTAIACRYSAAFDTPDAFLMTNYGASVASITSIGYGNWRHVAMSDDGTKIIVVAAPGIIRVSTDTGGSWTSVSITETWASVSCSGDFQYIIAGVASEKPYVSTDSGGSFAQTIGTAPTTGQWQSIAQVNNGTALITGATGVYYSGTFAYPLTIDSITPNVGSTSGGTPVTITGTGFDPSATAAIDGNAITSLTVVDSTTITGLTPAGTAGDVDVTVTNP